MADDQDWRVIPGDGILAPRTLRTRRRVLNEFWRWMGRRRLRPEDLTASHIDDWIRQRLEHIQASSCCAELVAIKMWVRRFRRDLYHSWDNVSTPSFTVAEPRALTEAEDYQVMSLAKKMSAWRLFALCRWAGLRVDEACHAEWPWVRVDGSNRTLCVQPTSGGWVPKTRRTRIIPISSSLWEVLEDTKSIVEREELTVRRIAIWWDVKGVWHEFISNPPWRPWAFIRQKVKKIPDGNAWHILRRTFATRAAQRGVRLEVIRRWMGHASIQTTMRYIDAAILADFSDIDLVE